MICEKFNTKLLTKKSFMQDKYAISTVDVFDKR